MIPIEQLITHTTPDAHCHKVERAIQQIDQKATAVLESLPYFLPTNLMHQPDVLIDPAPSFHSLCYLS